MKHLGDIQKINGAEIEPVDVITFGSPCQDLSIAGKRQGLDGERSGLFIEAVRVIKEMRDATNDDMGLSKPRYAVWENVFGSFSSNKGEDFRTVLESLARVRQAEVSIPQPCGGKWTHAGAIIGDGWSIAWRLMDAQYWGVPQRRKRIALVADFGGDTAPEICFERKGVFGDIAESGKEGQGTAAAVARGIGETSKLDEWCAAVNSGARHQQDLIQHDQGIARTLAPGTHASGSHLTKTLITSRCLIWAQEHGHQPIVYGISAYDSNAMKSSNPHSGIYQAETSRTLDLNGGSPACNQGGMAVVCATTEMTPKTDENGVCFSLRSRDYKDPQIVCLEGNGSRPSHQGDGWHEGNPMYTLNSTEHHAVCIENHPADSRVKVSEDGIVQTLSSRMGTGGGNVPLVVEPYTSSKASYHQHFTNDGKAETLVATDYKDPPTVYNPGAVCTAVDCRNATENEINGSLQARASNNLNSNNVCRVNSVIRRLTPLECERLQGFPDGWTDIPGASDTARYKALGNSIALPQWVFILSNISKHLPAKATLGSLFDGISGFPLIWQRLHGDGSARWASEIEQFPISVNKYHFGEE